MPSFVLNTKQAIGDFRKYDKKVQKRLLNTLRTYAFLAAGEQRGILLQKVKKWTGRLASSIRVRKVGPASYEIGPRANKVEYAWFIEEGHPPYKINAKPGGWLHFKIGPNWIKTKSVNHPGFEGYHYVRDSITKIKSNFIKSLKKDIEGP